MKTGPELHKRNDQVANPFSPKHFKSTVLAEWASTVHRAINKKFTAQLATKKPCGKMPGTFCVLTIIQKSGEGVDPKTVKQMTGFNNQKVHKILYKLFKHGEIRIIPGGLYTGIKENIEYPLGE